MGIRNLYADIYLNAQNGKTDVPYPSKLELVRAIMQHAAEACSGSLTGTGSAIEVVTPFAPGMVILFNRTAPCLVVKMPGMAAAASMKLSGAPALTYTGTNLITLGVAAGPLGFTIGSDADLNTAAEVVEWVALGFRDQGSL